MKTLTLSFYECEHNQDMQNYISDMVDCGADIVSSRLFADEEICVIQYRVKDQEEFIKKFIDTDSYDFVN
jgi:hypothetical protein